MPWEVDVRRIEDKLNGLGTAVESGFRSNQKDIHYLGRIYVPLVAVSLLSLVLSISGLTIAMENRSLILAVSVQSSKNARELELITPLVPLLVQPTGPELPRPAPDKS